MGLSRFLRRAGGSAYLSCDDAGQLVLICVLSVVGPLLPPPFVHVFRILYIRKDMYDSFVRVKGLIRGGEELVGEGIQLGRGVEVGSKHVGKGSQV